VLIAGLLAALGASGNETAAALARRISLQRAARVTGVGGAALRAAAQALASRAPVMIVYGSGVTHQPQAAETIAAINALAAALHADVVCLPGAGNTIGAYDMGVCPDWRAGYRRLRRPGRDLHAILEGVRSGAVKALFVAGDVPPLPELAHVPFLIVQGVVHSDLMKSAQVVLPTTTFAEADGTLTNLEGRVQRLRKVIEPIGEARPGWMIARDLAQRLGVMWRVQSAADVLDRIADAVPAYAGVADGALRRFEPTPLPTRFSLRVRQAAAADDKYPVLLIAQRNQLAYGGASLTKVVKGMQDIAGENVLHVSPADAQRLGVAAGQPVKVVSAHGSVYWPAHIDDGLREGYAFASVNPVVGAPIYRDATPQSKLLAVRLEVSE